MLRTQTWMPELLIIGKSEPYSISNNYYIWDNICIYFIIPKLMQYM